MEIIRDYFPDLSDTQLEQIAALAPLYRSWNEKINVISRKDIDNLYAHHVLHAMSIAKVVQFLPGSEVLDLGTGGGFPGIPLAILFPETRFILVDGTRKKIGVVQEIIEAIGLQNTLAKHIRAEELTHKFDFVTCRAVASLEKLNLWMRRLIKTKQMHALPNGLLALKGGNNIEAEITTLGRKAYAEVYPLAEFYEEEYYEEKVLVYVQW